MHQEESYLLGFVLILVAGFLARWLAWRLHLPSILLLLTGGLIAGPGLGFLKPDELFGNALTPFVSISVALILFEGGLSLELRELKEIGHVVRNLVTLGVLVTWALAALGAWFILGFDRNLAVLLGAILVVTGPTVVLPLLLYIRPVGQVRTVMKWEGILNDPVGAILAVLVFEAILAGGLTQDLGHATGQFVEALLIGVGVGLAAAALIVAVLYFHWAPEFLDNALALAAVAGAYAVSNHFQAESGLLATTVMGIALANQDFSQVRHIIDFTENLRLLMISALFLVLAARLDPSRLSELWLPSLAFLAVLVFLVRPAAVWVSCLGSNLDNKQKLFLAWMAPRGIVAAAVSWVFTMRLVDSGMAEAVNLIPVTFLVIIGTVAVYGLTAFPVAKWLKLAEPSPQGVLFVGAHGWALDMAKALKSHGFHAALADSRWPNVSKARLEGIPAYYGSVLSEHVLDNINLYGIGKLLAVTPNDEANSLAAFHFSEVFGRKEVYQLPPESGDSRMIVSVMHLQGRYLFRRDAHFYKLQQMFLEGARLKTTNLTEKFNLESFRKKYGGEAIPMFVLTKSPRRLRVVVAEEPLKTEPGQSLISLLPADVAKAEGEKEAAQAKQTAQKREAGRSSKAERSAGS